MVQIHKLAEEYIWRNKMKTCIGILSILLMLTVGIAAAQDLNATDGKMDQNKTTNGKMLYNYITNDSSYKMWQMWPGKEEFYPGKEPHGSLLTTYVTDDALSAIESGAGTLPDGSIIVKENYMADKTLAALTVMFKKAGYDPGNNDWFWVRYLPNGTITAEGKVKLCIDCHNKPKAEFDNQINDYIFTSNLKMEEPVIPTETETVSPTIPPTTIPPTIVPTKSPGFGAIVGIIGLISVMYLFKKRNNR
jgi:hypothetical protein